MLEWVYAYEEWLAVRSRSFFQKDGSHMSNTIRIEEALAPLFAQENMELVDLRIGSHGAKTLFQFFIDRTDGANVTMGDCENMSRKIGAVLDMENLAAGAYVLEISSPGVDRVLRKPEHFRRFAGERVKITLKLPVENRAVFTGIIAEAGAEKMILDDGTTRFDFRYEDIKSARLEPVLEF